MGRNFYEGGGLFPLVSGPGGCSILGRFEASWFSAAVPWFSDERRFWPDGAAKPCSTAAEK